MGRLGYSMMVVILILLQPSCASNPMTNTSLSTSIKWLTFLFVLLFAGVTPLAAKDPKMKAEEVIAKHLASIGTPEARAAIRNRAVEGIAQVIFRLPNPGALKGRGHVLSEGRQYHIGMDFNALEYPAEQLAFDGDKVTVSQVRPGQRSHLSMFVYQFDVLMKEGLLGGVMTTAWALLDLPGRQPKLDYSGLKKIGGKQLHELKYRARKGAADLQVSLYFDPETFRHVSTQIRLVQPATMGRTPTESAGQRDTIQTIVESYDDFRTVDSLTLPHAYKLVQTIEGQNSATLVDYNIAAAQIRHNQTLDPRVFSAQ